MNHNSNKYKSHRLWWDLYLLQENYATFWTSNVESLATIGTLIGPSSCFVQRRSSAPAFVFQSARTKLSPIFAWIHRYSHTSSVTALAILVLWKPAAFNFSATEFNSDNDVSLVSSDIKKV